MTQAQFDALIGLQKQIAAIGHSLSDWVKELGPSIRTIDSVYGHNPGPACPPGFHWAGRFEPPKYGDWWLGKDGVAYRGAVEEPRLILTKTKRLVFDVIAENRKPDIGEWAEYPKGGDASPTSYGKVMWDWAMPARYILSEPRVEE